MAEAALFEVLEKRGITDGPSAKRVVSQLKTLSAVDLLADCFYATNSADTNREAVTDTLFTFAPNSSLAGGLYPCSNLQCRIECAYRLALFGAIYADSLVLPNAFDYFYHMAQAEEYPFSSRAEEEQFKERLGNDIAVTFQYLPLFEAGLAKINHTLLTVCTDCLRKRQAMSRKFEAKISSIYSQLEPKFRSKVQFILEDPDYIKITDKSDYVVGSTGWEINGALATYANKVAKSLPHVFTKAEVDHMQLFTHLLNQPVNDLLERNYYPDLSSATYLTNRQVDIDLLESSDAQEKIVSPVKPDDFYHSLPFLNDILIEDLVKLRSNEGDSFQVYRDALTSAIKEKDAPPSEVVQELIIPAVNKVQNVITNNKRYYRSRAGKKIVVDIARATAGLAVGALFNTPVKIPGVTLAAFSTQSIVSDLINAGTIPMKARNSSFYFLWKVKGLSSHAE